MKEIKPIHSAEEVMPKSTPSNPQNQNSSSLQGQQNNAAQNQESQVDNSTTEMNTMPDPIDFQNSNQSTSINDTPAQKSTNTNEAPVNQSGATTQQPTNTQNDNHTTAQPASVPMQPQPLQVNSSNEPPIPYLASLSAFVGLLVMTFYSTFTLFSYALEKLFETPKEATEAVENSMLSFGVPDFSYYVAIGAVATLLVCLPATVLLATIVKKYEAKEPWRKNQKTRRGIYIIGAVFLISALVSTFISTTFGVFSTSLEIDSVRTSAYIEEVKINKGTENTKIILQGIFDTLIIVTGLLTLGFNYVNRHKKFTWITMGALGVIALILIPFTTYNVHSDIKDQKKIIKEKREEREKEEKERQKQQEQFFNNRNTYNNNPDDDSLFN